jgi:hypothetical protein
MPEQMLLETSPGRGAGLEEVGRVRPRRKVRRDEAQRTVLAMQMQCCEAAWFKFNPISLGRGRELREEDLVDDDPDAGLVAAGV